MRRTTAAVVGLRLQGFEEGGPTNQWVGLSQFLPGGGAGPDSTPFEKVYVVLDGEMTVSAGGDETVLGRYDSCTIAPGEERVLENRSNQSAPCSSSSPIRRGVNA